MTRRKSKFKQQKKKLTKPARKVAEEFSEYLDLAISYHQEGKLEQAIANYQKLLSLKPTADVHNNLGVALQSQGKLDSAIIHFQQALILRPRSAYTNYNLGLSFQKKGQLREAISYYQKSLALDHTYVEAYNNLGIVLYQQGELEVAIKNLETALLLKPDWAEVHLNLGVALKQIGKLETATTHLNQAITLKPDFSEAYLNLGVVLKQIGKLESAISYYQQAIKIQPNYAEAYNNLGLAWQQQDKLDIAISQYQQAINFNPQNPDFYLNLGCAFQDKNQIDEAIASYKQAIEINPKFAKAHLNLGTTLLLKGEVGQGFAEYEWRWQTKEINFYLHKLPLWDGSDLEGRNILLCAEQGYGDTIQFIRYAPLVKEKGGYVTFECYPALLRLLANFPGIDQIVEWRNSGENFDVYAPLMSLPHILRTSLNTIPAKIPYLWFQEKQNPEKFELETYKIGIVWAGSATRKNDRFRSTSLVNFLSLQDLSGVSLYSLQKQIPERDIETLKNSHIQDLSYLLNDFADTAEMITKFDLIITVDTAVAHLAGAMGKQVWVLLSFAPDWRWMLDRNDTPWYSTMRLFRQQKIDDWEGVFERVKFELKKHLNI